MIDRGVARTMEYVPTSKRDSLNQQSLSNVTRFKKGGQYLHQEGVGQLLFFTEKQSTV